MLLNRMLSAREEMVTHVNLLSKLDGDVKPSKRTDLRTERSERADDKGYPVACKNSNV